MLLSGHLLYCEVAANLQCGFVFFFYLHGDESGSVQEVFPAVGHFSTQTVTTRFLPPVSKDVNNMGYISKLKRPH